MNPLNKIQFEFKGHWIIVPDTVVKIYDENGIRIPTTLVLEGKDISMMLKQYIKESYPKYKFWISVQSHTLGVNLFEMYISEKDGSEIPHTDFKIITDYIDDLKTSRYCTQTHTWHTREIPHRTSKGHQIRFEIDDYQLKNEPKYGTYEWGVNQIKTNNADLHGAFQNHFSNGILKRLKKEFGQYAATV